MAQRFLLIPIRPGGVALISFQMQSSLFFPGEHTAAPHGSSAFSSQKRNQSAEQHFSTDSILH